VAFTIVLAVALSGTAVGAQTDKAAIERGRALFAQHCASCHGKSGRGDGPTAATLARKAHESDGDAAAQRRFFRAQIESAVQGTNASLAHRAPDMLVWGALFRATRAATSPPRMPVSATLSRSSNRSSSSSAIFARRPKNFTRQRAPRVLLHRPARWSSILSG
jgi:hypothetical protein